MIPQRTCLLQRTETPGRGPHIRYQTFQCDPQPSDVLGPQTGKYEHLKKPKTVMALPQYERI
jgi:hypothetical protein